MQLVKYFHCINQIFYRNQHCTILIPTGSNKCHHCRKAESSEKGNSQRKSHNLLVPAKINAPIKFTSPQRLKLTIQNYRSENKALKVEIDDMKREILTKSKPIDDELSKDFVSIMSNVDKDEIPPFMKFLWEEQQNYLSSSTNGVQCHPMIIRHCLNLASKSPSFYDDIRYDNKVTLVSSYYPAKDS